jgi:type I restriction enzyme, S subunit
MRAMKDSGAEWLGEVPEAWEILPPGAVFRSSSTKGSEQDVHLTPSQKLGVLPQTDYMAMSGSRVVLQSTESGNMKLVLPGDFISHLRSFQGGLEISNFRGKVSGAYTVLRPVKQMVGQYFKWLLKSSLYVQGLQTTTDQLRDGQTLRMAQLRLLRLPFPSLSEQEKIATYLDQETSQIDALISKKEQLIEKLLERRQALITQIVTKGLDPNVPMKDSGVDWMGAVPQAWTVTPLKSVVKLNPESLGEKTDSSLIINYIEIGDVAPPSGVNGYKTSAFGDSPSRARRLVKPGDVLISTVRTYLKAIGLVPAPASEDPWVASTGFAALRPTRVDSRFLELALSADSFIFRIQANSVGVSYPGIDASKLVRFRLAIPPKREQEDIVHFLDKETLQIDTLVEKTRKAIELLKERRQTLITQVVTGKIDVRGFAGGNT